ncbi:MAG: glycosyltransferase family 4 protein [Pseudomonadota bacterium]
MTETPDPRPLAYLTGEFPRATDTFVLREILALRELGETVLTCSVRRTDPSHHVGPEQKEAAATTFNVLDAARNPIRLLSDHFQLLRAAPLRWLRALWLALRSGGPGPVGLLYQLFYFAEAGVLARHLQRKNVRHLHNHFANSSCSVAMLTSELSGIPFSFTMHGPAIFFEPRRWRIDVKIARARFVACISHFCRSQAMLFSDPEHWEKLHIVHCGVDPARYDRPPQRDPERPLLLFVGRLARIKGLGVLLEAFAKVREAHSTVRLRLVGDGPDRAWLEAKAKTLGVAEHVEFTGYQSQDQVTEHLAQSDILVLPSFAEGVPVVLMEAMAAGVPVIASRVAGVQELVEDGVSGFAVPPGDVETLGTRIEALLRSEETREHMSVAGRSNVATDFNSISEASWLLEILRFANSGRPCVGLRPDAL